MRILPDSIRTNQVATVPTRSTTEAGYAPEEGKPAPSFPTRGTIGYSGTPVEGKPAWTPPASGTLPVRETLGYSAQPEEGKPGRPSPIRQNRESIINKYKNAIARVAARKGIK
jgi:hypothetical protein